MTSDIKFTYFSSYKSNIPTNTPRGFHVETTWKRSLTLKSFRNVLLTLKSFRKQFKSTTLSANSGNFYGWAHITANCYFNFNVFPTNTLRGFHVETTWKRSFPRRFKEKSTCCVSRVEVWIAIRMHTTTNIYLWISCFTANSLQCRRSPWYQM